jgi:hypothetical protein
MTLGERLDNSLADGLVALGVGLRRTWIVAAKAADRLLGGSPCNGREAQRFLTMGGSERLNAAEAADESICIGCMEEFPTADNHECPTLVGYQPDALWSAENRRQEFEPDLGPFGVDGPIRREDYTPQTSAPAHSPDAVERDSPELASPPGASSGQPTCRLVAALDCSCPDCTAVSEAIPPLADDPVAMRLGLVPDRRIEQAIERFDQFVIAHTDPALHAHFADNDDNAAERVRRAIGRTQAPDSPGEQPVGAGVSGPDSDGSPGCAEHPLYRQIQEQADAAIVAEVLSEHKPGERDFGLGVYCGSGCQWGHGNRSIDYKTWDEWREHVAPFITRALQQ